MNLSRRYLIQILGYILIILLPITLVIYLLRGIGVLGGISGGVILFLLLFSWLCAIAYGLEKTQ